MKIIDEKLLDDMLDKANSSERRRSHYLIHDKESDPVQRMLVAVMPDSYIRPHIHPQKEKWEMITVLRGSFLLFAFNSQGIITDRIEISAGGTVAVVELPAAQWHCMIALEPSIFLEVKEGAYIPSKEEDFAKWAPAENSKETSDIIRLLTRAQVGASCTALLD